MERVFVGVDPGASGYICILEPLSQTIKFIENKAKFASDIFNEVIDTLASFRCERIMIEEVHSLHGMSAKSNFSFGWNTGEIHMLLALTGYPVETVQPKAWQKRVGVEKVPPGLTQSERSKAQKASVATACNLLYPDAPIYGPRGGLQDGKSDSLLIAHYNYLTQDTSA